MHYYFILKNYVDSLEVFRYVDLFWNHFKLFNLPKRFISLIDFGKISRLHLNFLFLENKFIDFL